MAKLVTVATARRILGSDAKGLSDDQVQELLDSLYLIAGEQLMYNGSKNEEKSSE